ncbi:MAG: c-type cytochrome [Betaproteobacteria bacterium]|nr:c-type cytochrome [Betaproteobacteria bacterium]
MLKRTLLLSLLLTASGTQAQDHAAVQRLIPPEVCATCHGTDGNNWVKKDDGTFGKTQGGAESPKLSGQNSEYLLKQFKEFKSTARANAIMNGMITMLPDEDMKAAAEFFAAKKLEPAASKNDKNTDAFKMGEKLWRAGLASKGLPACAACHGPAGKGMPAQYPALAGQFPEYIEAQLKAFRDETRANDPSKMMRAIALKMTDKEIQAVADYAAGLR